MTEHGRALLARLRDGKLRTDRVRNGLKMGHFGQIWVKMGSFGIGGGWEGIGGRFGGFGGEF